MRSCEGHNGAFRANMRLALAQILLEALLLLVSGSLPPYGPIERSSHFFYKVWGHTYPPLPQNHDTLGFEQGQTDTEPQVSAKGRNTAKQQTT